MGGLTSEHLMIVSLEVMDGALSIRQQGLDGLATNVCLCGSNMVQSQPAQAGSDQRRIQQQRQQHNASRPERDLHSAQGF